MRLFTIPTLITAIASNVAADSLSVISLYHGDELAVPYFEAHFTSIKLKDTFPLIGMYPVDDCHMGGFPLFGEDLTELCLDWTFETASFRWRTDPDPKKTRCMKSVNRTHPTLPGRPEIGCGTKRIGNPPQLVSCLQVNFEEAPCGFGE